jgi:hypothetical protein
LEENKKHKSLFVNKNQMKDADQENQVPKEDKLTLLENILLKKEDVKNVPEEPLHKKTDLKSHLLSTPFLALFFHCGFKAITNFTLGSFLKEFGMYYLKDDYLVTMIGLICFVFALLIRTFLGKLTSLMGLTGVHTFNLVLEVISPLIIWKFGWYKLGFFLFFIFNRISGGK